MEMNPQKYEYSNCVVVPLAFFDKLMKCYYGTGPRDGGQETTFIPQNKSSEVITEISELKDITIDSSTPPGFTAKGLAAEKLKAKQRGIRYPETTEKPD
tara:strand:- start:17 stop:313 length:297 start_codon:yes stop_codon:yes gene_type:complete